MKLKVSSGSTNLRGDKICLHQSMLEQLMGSSSSSTSANGGPLVFRISSGGGDDRRFVYAGIREFTALTENSIEMSPWLLEQLDIKDDPSIPSEVDVQVLHGFRRGLFARLQAMSPLTIGMDECRSILESFIRQQFTCLTLNTQFAIPVAAGGASQLLEFKVTQLNADGEENVDGVSVVDTDLAVDIVSALVTAGQVGPNIDSGVPINLDTATLSWTGQSISLAQNSQKVYKLSVPNADSISGKSSLKIQLECLSGDVDLFVSSTSSSPNEIDCDSYNVSYGSKNLLYTFPQDRPFIYIAIRPYNNDTNVNMAVTAVDVREELTGRHSADTTQKHTSDDILCSNCKAWIHKNTFKLHEAFCLRNNTCCSTCGKVFKKSEFSKHWHCPSCPSVSGDNAPTDKDKHDKYEHSSFECKCGQKFTLSQLLQHRKLECEKRLIICRYCHVEMEAGPISTSTRDYLQTGSPLTQHESQCGSRTIVCNKCQKPILIKDVPVHMKMHETQKRLRLLPMTICRNSMCSNAQPPSGHVNSLRLCSSCFGPFWNANIDPNNEKLLQRLVGKYFTQLNEGCARKNCWNPYCKSSQSFEPLEDSTPNGLAFKALDLCRLSCIMPDSSVRIPDNNVFYFCVDETNGFIRRLAETKLVPMGYKIEWAVEAMKKTFQSFSKFNNPSLEGDIESSDDDMTESNEKSFEEYENSCVEKAVAWLIRNEV